PYNIGILFGSNAIYTLSNPDAGRFWWPSYDHPWDKALVDWHITIREDWLAAANGLRTSITDNGNGKRTHHWHSASPVATYVIGFAAGPYTELNSMAGNLPIQNFVQPALVNNATADFANVPAMIDYFSELYGPYPFEKYGHMTVNMATYAAMEHQTMTTFGTQYIDGQQTYESIVAHELTHQWYGNYLTPITMREVWLKESFATYSEMLWTNRKSGWEAACQYLKDEIQDYYLSWENSNGPHTIYNPEYNLMFAPPTYEKSASVLHMLRLKMGNEAYFSFIRSLLTTFPNGNIRTSEFIDLAEAASGLNLNQFFEQWIYSPGVPNARLSIWSDQQNVGKVYAKSISPTATTFMLDIPLSLPGSAVADSVVIVAAPTWNENTFAITPADDISTLLIDPHHWVLTRQLERAQLQLISCLPYKSAVSLKWNAYGEDLPVVGYHVFRRELPDGNWQQISTELITTLSYTDPAVSNGMEYQYYVCAIDDEGFYSEPSSPMSAKPISFPFDLGMLVIDETKNGNGSAISPTNVQVDEFYHAVLDSLPYSEWGFSEQGAPDLETLSHHPLILWHADDFSELQMLNSLDTIGSYVLSGGKIIISGWKYPSIFSEGFIAEFLNGEAPIYHNGAVLDSLTASPVWGLYYPTLIPDPDKLAPSWNGRLPMSYTFSPASGNRVYDAWMTEESEPEWVFGAIKVICGSYFGKMVLLGSPLYFMQEEGVRGFLHSIIPQLYPEIYGPIEPVPYRINIYPNPCTPPFNLTLRPTEGVIYNATIYNLKGQQVLSVKYLPTGDGDGYPPLIIPSNMLEKLSSGIYLIKMRTSKGTKTGKFVLLR
ncbi:MAG: T9SS type A sorting domain-containing protein, partial [Candidatus Cloacimonetes bacterium]|nr:T9SS type A sorting domain-containing protein [Candidatus Cloacimonadota bacterium]